MDALLRDLRLAVRSLARRPGVSALAIFSLGLAIGFCTAGFSLIDAFAWRDLPVRDPARLARVYVRDREQRLASITWPEYQALAAHSRAWEDLAVECRMGPKVRLADRDDFPITAGVSNNYFDLLGVKAATGEAFHAGPGQDGIVVITDHHWRRALGGDMHVVGRKLAVGAGSLTITAVLTPGFSGTYRGLVVDLFVPSETFFGSLGFKDHLDPKLADFEGIGRLRPGATLAQANKEEEAVLRRMQADRLAPEPGRKAAVSPFDHLQPAVVAVLIAPFALVLLIAAAASPAHCRLLEFAHFGWVIGGAGGFACQASERARGLTAQPASARCAYRAALEPPLTVPATNQTDLRPALGE